jgi:phosphoserine phosphatase RsbU/P
MYATAAYGVLDASRGTLRVASAGHPLPLLVRNGQVTPVSVDTVMCLLWNELGDVPCADVPLRSGDRVVFYTDGITDRQGPNGDMYDADRLVSVLGRVGSLEPADIVLAIGDDLAAFSEGTEPDDDQTLLVVGLT